MGKVIRAQYMDFSIKKSTRRVLGGFRVSAKWRQTAVIPWQRAILIRDLLNEAYPDPCAREMKRIGQMFANLAYNAKQSASVPEDYRASLAKLGNAWDDLMSRHPALAAPSRGPGTPAEAHP
jgi:hypothetical protein